MTRFSLALVFTFLFSFSVFAQNPTQMPPPANPDSDTIKISTTLIQVDVSVTDKDGNSVSDLKPEDFEVYENGEKQEITNFSFISINKPSETTKLAINKNSKDYIPVPSVKLKPEQVRRTYALVVDDLGLNFGNVFWVKQSLKKFVNEQMQEGDLVAIIRTGAGIGALQSFTSDKRQLLAAIEKIKWNAYGRSGTSTFDPINTTLKEDLDGMVRSDGSVRSVTGTDEEKEFEQQLKEFRNDNFSVGTLGALGYVIRGMRELPGRKAIMLFSEGFVLTSDNKPNRVLDAMKVLADMANRSSVVVYTFDPRGLAVPMFEAQDSIRDIFSPRATAALDARASAFRESQQSLRYLAYETGGIPLVNQNDLDKGLLRAVNDQGSYYLLGYQPDESTFDPKKNRFNKLEVKLKRPGLKVRYRSGFFGITDERLNNVARTPQQRILQALTSPFGSTDVDLNLYPVFQNDVKNGNIIQALVYIDAKDLKFLEANSNRKANFDLIAMTFGDNGAPVDQHSKNYTLEVPEKVYRNMLDKGFVYTLSVPIKKAGAYQFRIALRDTNSDKIGSASQFIEVPNIEKRMALSNLVLDNFTAQEWQKVRLGGNADTNSEKSVLLDTTLRQFKRGTILRYDYVVYNPKQSQQLETQVRLIRDGKVVYEEKPTPLKTNGQADLLRIQTAGAISLGNNLMPGSYILQIIVTDNASKKRFAQQFTELEITE